MLTYIVVNRDGYYFFDDTEGQDALWTAVVLSSRTDMPTVLLMYSTRYNKWIELTPKEL